MSRMLRDSVIDLLCQIAEDKRESAEQAPPGFGGEAVSATLKETALLCEMMGQDLAEGRIWLAIDDGAQVSSLYLETLTKLIESAGRAPYIEIAAALKSGILKLRRK